MKRATALLVMSLVGCGSATSGSGAEGEGEVAAEGEGDAGGEGDAEGESYEGEGEEGLSGVILGVYTQGELEMLSGTEVEFEILQVSGTVTNLEPLRGIRFETLAIRDAQELLTVDIDIESYPSWSASQRFIVERNPLLTSFEVNGPMIHESNVSGEAFASIRLNENQSISSLFVGGYPNLNALTGTDNPSLCNVEVENVEWIDFRGFGFRGSPCIPASQIEALEQFVGPPPGPSEGEGEPSEGEGESGEG
jgi:hypothetical protein